MPDTPTPASALATVLAPDFAVIDHGELLQITLPDGAHVALVGLDPLQVELELSVVLAAPEPVEPEALQAWGSAADAHLRAEVVADWQEVGFVVPPVGSLAAGEVEDDPDRKIWSYELPATVFAASLLQVRDIVEWGLAREREFVLWDVDGPMTPLQPVG